MAAHSVTAYDAALAGCAGALLAGRSPQSATAGDYATIMNIADAIAQEIDTVGQFGAFTAGKQDVLMTQICYAVLSGRVPQSLTLADYATVAAAICAAYTEVATKIQ